MLGVDFVISALFETTGLRWEGDCALSIVGPAASNAEANTYKLLGRMGQNVIAGAKSQSAKKDP
jgi:hypothetical protein